MAAGKLCGCSTFAVSEDKTGVIRQPIGIRWSLSDSHIQSSILPGQWKTLVSNRGGLIQPAIEILCSCRLWSPGTMRATQETYLGTFRTASDLAGLQGNVHVRHLQWHQPWASALRIAQLDLAQRMNHCWWRTRPHILQRLIRLSLGGGGVSHRASSSRFDQDQDGQCL